MKKKIIIKLGIFSLTGAIVGYGYYYFVGCRTGSCPLTSNPIITTLYGSLIGLVLGSDLNLFSRREKKQDKNSKDDK